MDYLQVAFLAVVQGITEFLPISSDGHLVAANALWKATGLGSVPEDLLVTIALHLGTLASILVVFWERILRLLTADRRVILLLVIATLPAVIVGLVLKRFAAPWLVSPRLTAAMFPLNALILFWGIGRSPGDRGYEKLSWRAALWIGVCQSAAILPGISRSGTTIAAGLGLGLRRDAAAAFSFLMAIPAILGAGVLGIADLAAGRNQLPRLGPLAVGMLIAFVVGVLALRGLLALLERGRLAMLGWWCVLVGLLLVAHEVAAGKFPGLSVLDGRSYNLMFVDSGGEQGSTGQLEAQAACRGWSVGHEKS